MPEYDQRMQKTVQLYGYKYSVYNRIVRLVLEEKGIEYQKIEIDPFGETVPVSYLNKHPFGRVPTFVHLEFELYETNAIERYIDSAFGGRKLTPKQPEAVARMSQVIAIIDNYGYWPMVRQVYAQRVFAPSEGEVANEAEVEAGLISSKLVLQVLEDIANEGFVLNQNEVTLADCHLAPMLECFVSAEEGAEMLKAFPTLSMWWAKTSERPSLQTTRVLLVER